MKGPHATYVFPLKVFGAHRFESRCYDCEWTGEPRRDADEAVGDGLVHEATSDPRQMQIEDAAA